MPCPAQGRWPGATPPRGAKPRAVYSLSSHSARPGGEGGGALQIDQQILSAQLQKFITMILLGFFVHRIGLVSGEMHDRLNSFVMRVIVPAQLIGTVASSGGSESLRLLAPMTLGGLALFCLLFLFGQASGRLLGFRGDKLRVHTGLTFVGSTGFFGIPLVTALLGGLGAAAFGLFSLVDNLYVWTVGLQMSRGVQTAAPKAGWRALLRRFLEPATAAVFVGWAFLLLRVPAEGVFLRSLCAIGDCAGPLAMLCIGITISRSNWRILPRSWPALVVAALRMVLAPLVAYRACLALGVYQPAAICLALTAAMPSSSMFALM